MLSDDDIDDPLLIQARTMQAMPEKPATVSPRLQRPAPASPAGVSPPHAGCTLPPLTALDNMLSSPAVATLLGVDASAVVHWRRSGRGPRYVRAEGRVAYHPADVLGWLNANLVEPAEPVSRIYRTRLRECKAKQGAGKAAPGLP